MPVYAVITLVCASTFKIVSADLGRIVRQC